MDLDAVKNFWDRRAEKYGGDHSLTITNLEPDRDLEARKVRRERAVITAVLGNRMPAAVLDVGCGVGGWSLFFAERARRVVGIEYSQPMIEAAQARIAAAGCDRIELVHAAADTFVLDESFPFVFVSGLLLYLDDRTFTRALRNIARHTAPGGLLLLREPAGVHGRYEIDNRWSEALQARYSAVYRTREEMIGAVTEQGFRLQHDRDMFEPGSPFNKWQETRLRVYLFAAPAATNDSVTEDIP